MSRRRLVALVSAFALLALGLIAFAVVALVTQTDYGREQVREFLATRIAARVHGRMYVGRIHGGLLNGVTVDSLEIRDDEDSLFLATGPISLDYDPRDILDRRILLKHLEVERPVLHLRKHENEDWNFRRIFPPDHKPSVSRETERAFGDFIVADSVRVHDATVVLTMPWHPDDSLHGARRDSAIAANLHDADHEVRRTKEGLARTWRWTGVDVVSDYARLADPDSTGKFFRIADAHVDETDPPFRFRNLHGSLRILGDSIWFGASHFDLPASTGSAHGKIVWGSDLPVRYAIHVVGDSVALRDVAWVYPTLPRTGGGRMQLDIRNEKNLDIIDYALSDMDVQTTGSHIRGAMTFGVGGPVLIVKDLDLAASPVNFDFIRALNGKPFPVDWRGELFGVVKGRGGPVTHFLVDDARVLWRDTHVPGAVSRVGGRGELDILDPAFTAFHGFDVDVTTLDLRSIEYLFPSFPRLLGTLAGKATLDSSWLDVRFSNADVTWSDGAGAAPSRVTGSGRVTYGEPYMTYDVDVVAQPLSLDALTHSYPALALTGVVSGPIKAAGTIGDLALATTLTGPAGTLAFDGRIDADTPSLGVHGKGSVSQLDVRRLLARAGVPATRLTGSYDAEVAGDSLVRLQGMLAVDLARSEVDGVRVYPSFARLRFGDGRVRVDTMRLETAAATLQASGGLGLGHGVRDSLAYRIYVDSLGGLRPYLAALSSDSAAAAADSLSGALTLAGHAVGSIDSLDLIGTVLGRELYRDGDRASALSGSFSLAELTRSVHGSATLQLDTATIAGVRLQRAGADLRILEPRIGRFAINAVSENGPTALFTGGYRRSADTTLLTLDDAQLRAPQSAWRLTTPAHIATGPAGTTIDSLALHRAGGGVLSLRGALPASGAVELALHADSLPLADLGEFAQIETPLSGLLTFDVQATGPRGSPQMTLRGVLNDAQFGGVHLEQLRATGRYAAQHLDANVELYRAGKPVLGGDASLPVDLALVPVSQRLLDAPLHGTIHADSVDLALLEAFSPDFQRATGRLDTRIAIGGTWKRPSFDGSLHVTNGAVGLPGLGVRLARINADLAFAEDSVVIRRLSAITAGAARGDSASLTGYVHFHRPTNPTFDLLFTAQNFHLMSRPRVADLDISTGRDGMHLTGAFERARLTGDLIVPKGVITIPELVKGKQVVALDPTDPELAKVVDTSLYMNRELLPKAPSRFVSNLTLDNVHILVGDDLWLRSSEANIKLGGTLAVTRGVSDQGEDRLALDGTITANRGSYTLNLGVVQRTFDVEGGKITFYGDPDLNPSLDIRALYTVKQQNQQDVGIRVLIGGTLARPQLELQSAEGLQISQSDLLSYLVTGQPSFEIGAAASDNVQTAAAVLLPSAGAALSGVLRNTFGSAFDLFQLQTANTLNQQNGSTGSGVLGGTLSVLANTRVGVGKQIGNSTFISANTGLCPLQSLEPGTSNQAGIGDFAEMIGLRVEHRLGDGFSLVGTTDPASSAALCNSQTGVRGFVPTKRQWGFDLFKSWSF